MSQQQRAGGEGGEGEEEGISLSDLNVKSPLHDEEEAKKPTDEDATQRLEVRSEHNTWVRDIFQIRSNDEVTESGKKVENTTAPQHPALSIYAWMLCGSHQWTDIMGKQRVQSVASSLNNARRCAKTWCWSTVLLDFLLLLCAVCGLLV
jgi:hypothetical protein